MTVYAFVWNLDASPKSTGENLFSDLFLILILLFLGFEDNLSTL